MMDNMQTLHISSGVQRCAIGAHVQGSYNNERLRSVVGGAADMRPSLHVAVLIFNIDFPTVSNRFSRSRRKSAVTKNGDERHPRFSGR